jgi:hypothetical protein
MSVQLMGVNVHVPVTIRCHTELHSLGTKQKDQKQSGTNKGTKRKQRQAERQTDGSAVTQDKKKESDEEQTKTK